MAASDSSGPAAISWGPGRIDLFAGVQQKGPIAHRAYQNS